MNNNKFNITEFISSINKNSVIGEYDQIIKYASNTDTYKNINTSTSVYITNFLENLFNGIDLKNISNKDLLEKVNEDYEQETARNEYVDSIIDIYYSKIYSSCSVFAEYTANALEEGLTSSEQDLSKILQAGQYEGYRQLNDLIYNELKDYLEERI